MHDSTSGNWLNTDKYPIDQPDSPALKEVITDVCAQLKDKGCAVLRDLMNAEALPDIAASVAELAEHAHFAHSEATVYGGELDPEFPEGHPRNRSLRRENGFVTGDVIGPETGLRRMYQDDDLKKFLARCLNIDQIHEFGDPLAQLAINVVKPEAKHAWHFDSNEFVVTLLAQPADKGGQFEYVPNIRSAGNENYQAVQDIIENRSEQVRQIDLRPGDLQIFMGRYSLHRVRETQGRKDRHTVIFSYSKEPGVLGRSEKTQKIFGRKLASHDSPKNDYARHDELTD